MSDEPRPATAGAGARKTYEPPRILFREKLEALAGTCDPQGGGKTAICSYPSS